MPCQLYYTQNQLRLTLQSPIGYTMRLIMQNRIFIKGAREHNLKNISVSISRDAITVITGPSGSGKSSLAIDTIYAEGQRRYVESLSAYSRQFLEQMQKPDIDYIEGLSPAIAINQRTISRSARSTLGTITEIYDYLRILFTRLGKASCYKCGAAITSQGSENILQTILSYPEGTRIQILAPIVQDRKGHYRKELQEMRSEGFVRARIDGVMVDLREDIILEKKKRHTIETVIDRLIIRQGSSRQISDAIEAAFAMADTLIVNLVERGEDVLFSRSTACLKCGISYPEITPRFFSFNSSLGACPSCNGLGVKGFLDGDHVESSIPARPCPACKGARLRKEALSVRFHGMSINEISRMTLTDALSFLDGLVFTEREETIARRILKEIRDRLRFLVRVGLSYLTLDRPAFTLSGGESQRVRLATQLGASLTGVLYILDEPSIGLHPRDCGRLLESLRDIKESGNTVIVVEHDEETILHADQIIDMGPGAGKNGGWIVAQGTPSEISGDRHSLTGRYLSGDLSIPLPFTRRKPDTFISILGAAEHNLKDIDVRIPVGAFSCVTGVSGSGKSTLILDILHPAVHNLLTRKRSEKLAAGKFREIQGTEILDNVIHVDQSPIGRTPRANPVTYTGCFTFIRELFAKTPEAKVRGYTPSRFSFNVHGGRCESCGGNGLVKIEMHFLPDVYVGCDQCKGTRYNEETLQIRYRGKNIAEVLAMTITEAATFFDAIPQLRARLALLEEIGLGYLQLGQPATTLSGGESQRLRLSRELSKRSSGSTLYIFDEPTTGLHFSDIQKLLEIIHRLTAAGNTVVVIEHNLDIIKSSDYVVDLGPEGGASGGYVMATGTPEEIAAHPLSATGLFLKNRLNATEVQEVSS